MQWLRQSPVLEMALSSARSRDTDVPATYTEFARWLGVELEAGQRVVASICYDGREPMELEGGDREAAARIFGPIDHVPLVARSVVGLVCGGRGGKSYALVALRLLHGLLVRDLSSLAAGQQAVALVIAPNDTLRQEVVNYALGAMRSKPELAQMLRLPRGTREDDVVSSFIVQRPDGRRVLFDGGVATRGGYGGRGRALTDVALDECAFFRDSSYKVNDKDIFEAASPRVLPGGQTILASTPWSQAGLLYETKIRNWGKPETAVVAHAPTLALRSSVTVAEMVAREKARDPENAAREFDAQFVTDDTRVFFDPALLEAAIQDYQTPRDPLPGESVAAGGDFGFRSDSSALVVAHWSGEKIIAGLVHELRPQPGQPLKPSKTVAEFAALLRAQRCGAVMADGHYRESITEHLDQAGLTFVAAPNAPHEAYVRARQLLRDGRIAIPRHGRLLQQLRDVQGRPLPGGGMSVVHQRWRTGGHGDIAQAWVLAVYQLAPDKLPEAPLKADDEAREARRRKFLEAKERPFWRRGR